MNKENVKHCGKHLIPFINGVCPKCAPDAIETVYTDTAPESILEEATRLVTGDRQASYGPPDQDFARTAKMWEALLEDGITQLGQHGKFRLHITPAQVAMCMIALKLSRETHQKKRDNRVDIAGYAHCLEVCRECE